MDVLTQTMPFAGAVLAVVSGTPSSSEACVVADDFVEADEVDADEVELAPEGADVEEAGSAFVVFWDDEEADPAPTPGAPATAGSTFWAFETMRCGRAFSSEEVETPLRERSSSDL